MLASRWVGRTFDGPPFPHRACPDSGALRHCPVSGERTLSMAVIATRQYPVLSFFGGPELTGPDGHAVRLTPTQDALLALVWGHEEKGVTRRLAIGLLWEEEDSPRGRHRLSQLLHELRSRMGVLPFELVGRRRPGTGLGCSPVRRRRIPDRLGGGGASEGVVIEKRGSRQSSTEDPRRGIRRLARGQASGNEEGVAGDRREGLGPPSARPRDGRRLGRRRRSCTCWTPRTCRAPQGDRGTGHDGRLRIRRSGLRGACRRGRRAAIRRMPKPRRSSSVCGVLAGHRDSGGPRAGAPTLPLVGRQRGTRRRAGLPGRPRRGRFEFVLLQGDSGVGKTHLWRKSVKRSAYQRLSLPSGAAPWNWSVISRSTHSIDALAHPDVGTHLRTLEEPWRAVIAALLPHLPAGWKGPRCHPSRRAACPGGSTTPSRSCSTQLARGAHPPLHRRHPLGRRHHRRRAPVRAAKVAGGRILRGRVHHAPRPDPGWVRRRQVPTGWRGGPGGHPHLGGRSRQCRCARSRRTGGGGKSRAGGRGPALPAWRTETPSTSSS